MSSHEPAESQEELAERILRMRGTSRERIVLLDDGDRRTLGRLIGYEIQKQCPEVYERALRNLLGRIDGTLPGIPRVGA